MSAEGAASPDPAPGLPPRYEVRNFLGKGAMGRVFLCRDTELDVIVAIKVLAPQLAADPAAVEQVRSEARAVAKFRGCPSILSLYGFERHEGNWYLVMEYASGGSLDEKLKREGRFPEAECRRIGAEVAEALDFAHRHRVLHRDIKPANILLDGGGRAKVADFGIAKVLRGEQESTSTLSISGTPVYMPPEAILRGPLDARSDIYSLGCMLYEMSTGKRPFAGTPVEIFMLKAGEQSRLPDVRALVPEISADYAAIVHRAAAPSPEERFPDGASLAAALRAGAPPAAAPDSPTMTKSHPVDDGATIKTAPEAPRSPPAAPSPASSPAPVPPVPSAQSPRGKGPLVAVAAVLLAAVGAWAIFGRKGGTPVDPQPKANPSPAKVDGEESPASVNADPKVENPPKTTGPVLPNETPKPETPKPESPKPESPKPENPKPAPPVEPPFAFAVALPAPKSPPPADRKLPDGFQRRKDGRIACLKDGSEMVLVPAGTFQMGNDEKGMKYEKPVRKVALKAYLIDRHEVTVTQYRKFCEARNTVPPAQVGPADGPVVGILWEDAEAYAKWAGKALPTEAQWERAARGTDGRDFPWGSDADTYACNHDGGGDTCPDVGRVASIPKDRSPEDCFDMGGNAQEWCQDWYRDDWYESDALGVDPTGPLTGEKGNERRVVRGGGANLALARAMTWTRSNNYPDRLKDHQRIGFRCVADLP